MADAAATSMIARTWHGRVRSDRADQYHAYLLRTGVPDYQATAGNRGVFIFRRTEGDVTHYVLTTLWESYDAIKAFAGPQFDKARYYPEDDDYLLECESFVMHYEVLSTAAGEAPRG